MKLLIPVAFALLAAQGVSEIVKAAAALTGARPLPTGRGGH
jgi:TRAP-type mannitol/chloroaromatic compound transport system permease small subunit